MKNVYRFASGSRKDLPLSDKGIPWEISTHDGKPVALFSDGTLAEFYIEDLDDAGFVEHNWPEETTEVNEPPNLEKLFVPVLTYDQAQEYLTEPSHTVTRPIEVVPVPRKRKRKPSDAGFYERAFKTKPFHSGYSVTLARYKTVEGLNPAHQHESVFAVHRNGRLVCNYDRETVGNGFREYLWLYQMLRSFGRGRIAAIGEAIEIYFL